MSALSSLRRLASALCGLALVGTVSVAAADSTQALTCPRGWGSTAEARSPLTVGSVTAVRAGRHTCFDRLVIDVTGAAPGYRVEYVTRVTAEGSGLPVAVAGGARLQVTVMKGAVRRPALPSVVGYTTFRQVAWAGSFEGYTSLGLGVRARLPFRTFVYLNPTTHRYSLVIDVAHRW